MRAATTSGADPDAGLVIDEVSVRYGDELVLDRLSLVVEPGEVLAVVGPSGSGKSTLLRAVAGLEPLAAGRIELGGRDLGNVPTHRRGLGLMFQDHGLFTHLDVAGNVGYGLRVAGMAAGEREERVAELVALVGLRGLEHRRVDQLSGGEAQRVALARALAPEPALLMLDEPLGSLDRALREQLTAELRRLLSDLGQTALHVTHDQSEAFALADRVAVIDGGRLVGVGRPTELWSDPGSVFVARFLGHPNLWTVTVDGGGVVRSKGITLGRVGVDHDLRALGTDPIEVILPTSHVEVVPTSHVDVVAELEKGMEAVVTEVVFDRGVHRVTAWLSAAPAPGHDDEGEGLTVQFERVEPLDVGASCRLRFGLEGLRPLARR